MKKALKDTREKKNREKSLLFSRAWELAELYAELEKGTEDPGSKKDWFGQALIDAYEERAKMLERAEYKVNTNVELYDGMIARVIRTGKNGVQGVASLACDKNVKVFFVAA